MLLALYESKRLEYARTAQSRAAPTLPMKLNADTTLVSVAAVGPRIVFVAAMSLLADDAEAMAKSHGITMHDWAKRVEEYTRNSICSMNMMAAFVRLGGEVEYVYKAADGRVLFSPMVGRNDCLNREGPRG